MKRMWTLLFGISILFIGSIYALPAMAITLNSINSTVNSSQNIQVTLNFSSPVKLPKSFSTQQPPRVIIDFFDVDKNITNPNQTIKRGFLSTINTISADGRTRIMLNLQQTARYKIAMQGNQVIITLFSNAQTATKSNNSVAVAPAKPHSSYSTYASHYIKGVNFKRNNSGGGDVILALSDPDVVINVNQENNLITVDLNNTSAPGTLQRRLDVTDFATPVQSITTQVEGNHAQVQIQAIGQFEQVAYQVNKQFIVSINPLSSAKKAESSSQTTYTGKPISLNFQDIPVRSILEVLAEFTGINIVAADSVKGNITLRLNNIPWDEALDIILKSSGLGQKRVGNVIMIAPAAEIAAEEKQELTAKQDFQQLEPLQTQYIRLNYAKATDVSALLKDQNDSTSLLSSRGNVSVDQRTNTLIVQDTPASIVNIQNLVAKLDIPVQQVMIEARIVNVDTSFEQDLGIRWGITKPEHVSGTLEGANQMLQNIQTGVVNPESAVPVNQRLNVDLAASISSVQQAPSVGIALANLGSGYMLDLELSAIEQEGGGELISSPRLVTANQHTALIESGTEIPYQQSTSSGATAVEFKKAVLSLRVTPQITPDGKIILDIKVNQDKVNPTLEVDNTPAIDTREIETNVLVNNGETIVLGGIYEEEQRKTVQRVPFLGSIPYLGALFRNSYTLNTRTELLIFITPKVIQQLPLEQ